MTHLEGLAASPAPKGLPVDYEPCAECGHDHDYEYQLAAAWHGNHVSVQAKPALHPSDASNHDLSDTLTVLAADVLATRAAQVLDALRVLSNSLAWTPVVSSLRDALQTYSELRIGSKISVATNCNYPAPITQRSGS